MDKVRLEELEVLLGSIGGRIGEARAIAERAKAMGLEPLDQDLDVIIGNLTTERNAAFTLEVIVRKQRQLAEGVELWASSPMVERGDPCQ